MKKRKDGRYQSSVMITDPLTNEKKRVYVYGYTEEEIYREKERVKRNNGAKNVLENMPFKHWISEWLQIKKTEISPSTLNDYTARIDKHIIPRIGSIPLTKITPSTIRIVLNAIVGERNKKYIYMLLRAILQQAYIDGIIRRNPCIAVKPPKYKPQEKKIISPQEFYLLVNYAGTEQYRRIFILAYYTGMRRAEICALKWENVDMQNNIIHVSSAAKRLKDGYILGEPKSNSGIRNIFLSRKEIDVLKQQYIYQKEKFLSKGDKVKSTDFVFTSDVSFRNMISPQTLSHTFERAKNSAGIRSAITFHSFRHTHTTMLVERGIPIKAIQARLGHSTPAFTLERYAHNTDKMQSEIVDILNKEPKII